MCLQNRGGKTTEKKENTQMKNQTFGVEIELTGITRKDAAKVIATYYGTESYYAGSGYDTYEAKDRQGRKWKAMSDSSIDAEGRGSEYKCEIVTPVCRYEDIADIQEIVRQLRHKGAKANSSCGIHVHVGAERQTAKTLRNLVNIMTSKEDLMFKALGVTASRESRWCKKNETRFVSEMNKMKPTSTSAVERLWYNGTTRSYHYDSSRYHALNLHSLWQGKGIEFRCFNGTTHAGKIKTYIQLCLAICNQALTQNAASYRKTQTTNDKYTFRTWLLRLGMIGDEFETARKFLLENLSGDTAFRYGRTRAAV